MDYISSLMPTLLNGALISLQVFFSSLVVSLPLGALIAFLMRIPFKPLQWLLNIYVLVMRGTPLLLQLIFIYLVLPDLGIVLDRLPSAILAFILNYAAYFSEIFRGGIESIPNGQYEAAKVLKLTPLQTVRYVVLPQVVKIVLPSVFNEVITLVKDTSLVYAVGVNDLLKVSQIAANRDVSLAPLFIAALVYLVLIGLVTLISKVIERKFNYYK